jgi:hypothetical protein
VRRWPFQVVRALFHTVLSMINGSGVGGVQEDVIQSSRIRIPDDYEHWSELAGLFRPCTTSLLPSAMYLTAHRMGGTAQPTGHRFRVFQAILSTVVTMCLVCVRSIDVIIIAFDSGS